MPAERSRNGYLASAGATYPLSKTMRENIEGMRKWAKYRARLASSEEKESLPVDAEDLACQMRGAIYSLGEMLHDDIGATRR